MGHMEVTEKRTVSDTVKSVAPTKVIKPDDPWPEYFFLRVLQDNGHEIIYDPSIEKCLMYEWEKAEAHKKLLAQKE